MAKSKKKAAAKKAPKKAAAKKAKKSIMVVSATNAVEARRELQRFFRTPQTNADGIERVPTPWERTLKRRELAAQIKAERRARSGAAPLPKA
jgi:predicted nucleotide-binding protein